MNIQNDSDIWVYGNKIYHLKKLVNNSQDYDFCIKEPFKIQFPSDPIVTYNNVTDVHFRFYKSQNGNKWIFSSRGLFKLDENNVFREFTGEVPLNEFIGESLFTWRPYNGGLCVYNPLTHSRSEIKPEICFYPITYLCQNNNLLWISNSNKSGSSEGLNQMILSRHFFKNYTSQSGIGEEEAVFSIFKDRNNIIWSGIRGRNHILQINPNGTISKTFYLTPELQLKTGHLRSIVRGVGGIWLGFNKELLLFFDYKNKKFFRHEVNSKYFHTILPSSDGSIFIGSDDILKYNPNNKVTQQIFKPKIIVPIYSLSADNNGSLWAGSNNSQLLQFDLKTGDHELIKLSEEPNNIESICVGDNNDLWLAYLGGGICNYNILTKKKKIYSTSTGLSNNTTYCILKDKGGYIWVSTDNGISRIDPKTDHIRTYGKNDGLDIVEFNADASFVANEGEFFFGGMGGFVGFYPDSLSGIADEPGTQRILLTDFKVSGEKRILNRPLNDADTIILLKGDNNFQLGFTSTDFINSDQTIFRYKLEGINNQWIITDSRNRNINFSNLKPGWAILQIQSADKNGNWISSKKIVFRITPHLYQTYLFLILVPVLITFLIAVIIIGYVRQLKLKEKQKQDVLKLESLRSQMNPHFIFNSLNSINYFISNNDKISANSYITDFSRLIRSMLNNLGSEFVSIDDEMNSLRAYLNIEHLRFSEKFDYKLDSDNIPKGSIINVLPGLVQPFIENAIWHGVGSLENRKGFILIKFLPNRPDSIKCFIEDDGVGRGNSGVPFSENHKSKGISIVLQRLQIISKLQGFNYNLNISDIYPNSNEKGTRVELDVPIKIIKSTTI